MSFRCVVAGCGPLVLVILGGTVGFGELAARHEDAVREIVPAYERGDLIAVLPVLAPRVATADARTVAEIDAALKAAEIPSSAELLLDARLEAFQREIAVSLPKVSVAEFRLTLPLIYERVMAAHGEQSRHPLMSRQLPDPREFKSYDELLADVAELQMLLDETQRLARYAGQQAARFRAGRNPIEGDATLQAAWKVDYAKAAQSIDRIKQDVQERVLELRLRRLDYAVDLLSKTKDPRARIRAAYVVDVDGTLLPKLLPEDASADASFQRPALRSPDLHKQVLQRAEQGRTLAGSAQQVSRLLFERVIPAYHAADVNAILQFVPLLLDEVDDEQLAAVDGLLKENNVPSVGRLLSDARLNARSDQSARQRRPASPKQREVLLTLPLLHEQLAKIIRESASHPAMADPMPIPAGFKQYHELLQGLSSQRGRLREALQVAELAASQARIVANLDRRLLDERQRVAADADYARGHEQATQLMAKTRQRELQMRLQRLDFAGGMLANSEDSAQRFLAAYVVDLDGALLDEMFNQHRSSPQGRQGKWLLGDRDLQTKTRDKVRRSRRAAGDPLIAKVRKLHSGLAWWVRGRYGVGPAFQGLLKDPRAHQSRQAQMTLIMPYESSAPTDPMSGLRQIPLADRRHHYTWAYQDQKLQVRALDTVREEKQLSGTLYLNQRDYHIRTWCGDMSGTITTPLGFKGSQTTTYLQTSEVQGHLTPAEKNLISRVVGYFEYQRALEQLDVLLTELTPQELDAVNEIIQSRTELAIYTNLSRRLEEPGRSPLSEPARVQGDDFKRHDLAWVMALARVELGAMLAAFTDVEKPFHVVRPSQFEADAYKELLLDGLRMHYWALYRDPDLRQVVSNRSVEQRWLTYGRRLVLARAFYQAVTEFLATDLSAAQLTELVGWKQLLNRLQVTVVSNVIDLLIGRTDVRGGRWTDSISPRLGSLIQANKTRNVNQTSRRFGQQGRSN